MNDLTFRAANEDDLDRILEIHLVAYPDSRGVPDRRRAFRHNAFGALEDVVVAVQRGDIVAHACLYPMETWFGGRPVPTGGIASVGVAPEARRQGVARALLDHLHRASDARGDALTMLYAFRHGFYASLGYGPTTSRRRLALDPGSIPEAWSAAARGVVRRARGEDKAGLAAVHARVAAARSGWLTRSAASWERRLSRERRLFLVADGPDGALAGYVAFELAQEEAHAATTALVEEIVAADDATRRLLLGALGQMGDQVETIELEVAANDPLELALVDPDRRRHGDAVVEHVLGAIVAGPMVRVEDVARAIEARGYAADGAFDVAVTDEIAVSVEVSGGRATVGSARSAAQAIRTTRAGLASLLYGGLGVRDAVQLGLAEADARTVERADAILALPPPAPIDPF